MTIRILFPALLLLESMSLAHEGHRDRTYEIRPAAEAAPGARVLKLDIREKDTGRHLAARFSFEIDGAPWTPEALNRHGIRFTSIHARKRQR